MQALGHFDRRHVERFGGIRESLYEDEVRVVGRFLPRDGIGSASERDHGMDLRVRARRHEVARPDCGSRGIDARPGDVAPVGRRRGNRPFRPDGEQA